MRRAEGMARRRVFVDTSAFFALADADDTHHDEARDILRAVAAARYRLFTTNILLIECHALILSSLGIARGLEFLRGMAASRTTVIRIRARDEERAQGILFQYADKAFSFADTISFAVMERLGIPYAFTFDRNFAQYGLTCLTPYTLQEDVVT
jgi:uncharacterized protein